MFEVKSQKNVNNVATAGNLILLANQKDHERGFVLDEKKLVNQESRKMKNIKFIKIRILSKNLNKDVNI